VPTEIDEREETEVRSKLTLGDCWSLLEVQYDHRSRGLSADLGSVGQQSNKTTEGKHQQTVNVCAHYHYQLTDMYSHFSMFYHAGCFIRASHLTGSILVMWWWFLKTLKKLKVFYNPKTAGETFTSFHVGCEKCTRTHIGCRCGKCQQNKCA